MSFLDIALASLTTATPATSARAIARPRKLSVEVLSMFVLL